MLSYYVQWCRISLVHKDAPSILRHLALISHLEIGFCSAVSANLMSGGVVAEKVESYFNPENGKSGFVHLNPGIPFTMMQC